MRILVLALALAACRGPVDAPTTTAAPEVAVASQPTDRAAVGISGVWTLEVRDPDGTVVSQQTVHNAYGDSTDNLVRILASEASPGSWYLTLEGASGANLCQDSGGSYLPCYIIQTEATETNQFSTLVLSHSYHTLTLEGSATAARDGTIAMVRSVLPVCSGATAPALCETPTPTGYFTSATLADPVDMKANQSVYVTFELGFADAS